MIRWIGTLCFLALLTCGFSTFGQDFEEFAGEPAPRPHETSATDHKVRVHKGKRVVNDETPTERNGGRTLKKQKSGGKGSKKDARVYKRHRHFAARDIRLRSKSKVNRKETLGVGTE